MKLNNDTLTKWTVITATPGHFLTEVDSLVSSYFMRSDRSESQSQELIVFSNKMRCIEPWTFCR